MRVTNESVQRVIVNDIQRNYERLAKYQKELSSGKRINVPSDDPIGLSRVFWLSAATSQVKQYETNIDTALDEMRGSSNYLNNVIDSLKRVKEVVVYAGNGVQTQETLNTYAYEVDAILQNVISYANSVINNKYVFSGFQTATVPFSTVYAGGFISAVNYNGDTGQRQVEINANSSVTMNFIGDNTANPAVPGAFVDTASGVNVFDMLIDLRDDLFAGNTANIKAVDTPALSNYLNHLESLMGMQAVQINEMEKLKDNHEMDRLFKTTLKVGIEEIDAAETISNISNQEVAYKASLEVGSRIFQYSLFDFLR